MLHTSNPYYNSAGEEVILLTYIDGHQEEIPFLRKNRDY